MSFQIFVCINDSENKVWAIKQIPVTVRGENTFIVYFGQPDRRLSSRQVLRDISIDDYITSKLKKGYKPINLVMGDNQYYIDTENHRLKVAIEENSTQQIYFQIQDLGDLEFENAVYSLFKNYDYEHVPIDFMRSQFDALCIDSGETVGHFNYSESFYKFYLLVGFATIVGFDKVRITTHDDELISPDVDENLHLVKSKLSLSHLLDTISVDDSDIGNAKDLAKQKNMEFMLDPSSLKELAFQLKWLPRPFVFNSLNIEEQAAYF